MDAQTKQFFINYFQVFEWQFLCLYVTIDYDLICGSMVSVNRKQRHSVNKESKGKINLRQNLVTSHLPKITIVKTDIYHESENFKFDFL